MAARRYSPICLAVPSAVFKAMLPVKPSVTTTSTAPCRYRRLRRNPDSDGKRRFLENGGRLLDFVEALDLFHADIEEPDRRLSMPKSARAMAAPIRANSTSWRASAPNWRRRRARCIRPRWSARWRRSPAVDAGMVFRQNLPWPSARRCCRRRPRRRRGRRAPPRAQATCSTSSGPCAAPGSASHPWRRRCRCDDFRLRGERGWCLKLRLRCERIADEEEGASG